jgi:hypothetical protein
VSKTRFIPSISTVFPVLTLQKQTNFITLSWLLQGASKDQGGTCEQSSKSTFSATQQSKRNQPHEN